MSEPIAVCISDIHFNINTLTLASAALSAALKKAEDLNIPLIIAGDLNDTKAIIRGEVVNRLIEITRYAKTKVYILAGNHDLINEKGEEHTLNFLRPYAQIIDQPDLWKNVLFIPYQSSKEKFKEILDYEDHSKGGIIICHQGFLGAQMGDYIQDKSSISTDVVKDFTVISGHYHKHQTIGTVTYIGSPYTITFTEANDPPKGFLVLYSDGTFTREILGLRKHVIIETDIPGLLDTPRVTPGDLIWLKVKGPQSQLKELDKKELGERLFGHSNYKLDLIPTDSDIVELEVDKMQNDEILDALIDACGDTGDTKIYLKKLWRDLL